MGRVWDAERARALPDAELRAAYMKAERALHTPVGGPFWAVHRKRRYLAEMRLGSECIRRWGLRPSATDQQTRGNMIRLCKEDFADLMSFQDFCEGLVKCEGLPVEVLRPDRLCDIVYEHAQAESIEWLCDLFAYNAAQKYLPRLRKALSEAEAARPRLAAQAAQAGAGMAEELDARARGLARYANDLSAAIGTLAGWTCPPLPWRKQGGDA